MRKRDRKRREARSARPFRRQKRRILAICEGKCTEPEYLKGFERAGGRHTVVEVKVEGGKGDPRAIVLAAKDARSRAEAAARRQGDPMLAFDEVWCVFDRDEHTRFDEAMNMAAANGLCLAVSNPCIELWLLLHFRESPGSRHRAELASMLKNGFVPLYDKHIDFRDFEGRVEQATLRAKQLDERAADRGDPPYGNPSSTFFRLTDSISEP